jgi:hypothetical protein
MDDFNFLNGRARAVAPFFTDFFRDAALLERVEDLVEEVSVDFAMMEKTAMTHFYC